MSETTRKELGIIVLLLFALATHVAAQSARQDHMQEAGYSLSTHVYKVVDSHQIKADVYRAPGEDIRPVLLFIHGGALIMGSRKWVFPWQIQEYIQAGFVVVSIDYRLAPETKLPQIVQDLEDAYSWLRSRGQDLFRIDPGRIAVTGPSAGGYLSLLAGFRLAPRPRAIVSFYGLGDITNSWVSQPSAFYNELPEVSRADALEVVGDSVVSVAEDLWPDGRTKFYLHCRQQGIWPEEVTGRDPDTEKSWYAAYEVLHNVTTDYPPTLLLHGEKDTDVSFEQSVAMAEALRRHKVPHDFITNPDWGHVFDQTPDSPAVREAFDRVVEFLVEHTK